MKPWLILAAIFLAGLVSGVGLSAAFRPHFEHSPHPGELKRHVMDRLTHELQLTKDEQAKIEPIVEKSMQDINAVHADEAGRISKIIQQSTAQIAPLLTADQKTRLDQIEAERRKMFAGHMRMWGFAPDAYPHGGPGEPPPSPPPPPAPPEAAAPSPANAPAH